MDGLRPRTSRRLAERPSGRPERADPATRSRGLGRPGSGSCGCRLSARTRRSRGNGGFNVSIDALRRIRALRLPPGDKLTLMIIATYADRDDSNAFPSVRLLAEQSGCTERAIQQRLARLRRGGYLEVQTPARQHRPTTYRVVPNEARGEPEFAPEAQPGVNGDSPLGTFRGEARTARGEREFAPGVNGGSPDQYRDQSTDQKDKPAAAPRFSAQAREPNGNGNYRVIQRVAMDLLNQRQFDSENDLVDAVKWACADRCIDYGAHPDVGTHVVHRACASAWTKARPTVSQRAIRLSRHPGRTGPPPAGKYDRVTASDDE